MARASSKKVILSLFLTLFVLNAGSLASFSQEEEEPQFTQANEIDDQKLNNLQDRSYDEGITVKEIEIKGNNLVKTEIILDKLAIKQGSRFDRNLIQKDLKTIYDMGYFTERLKAIPEPSSTGIKLRIEVEENAPVTGFNITGNEVISTEDLSNIFNSQTGLPQNIAELNKAVESIENLYSEKGYILARVKRITDDPDGMINIDINEGVIDDIKLSGNTKTKDFVIKRNMVMTPGMVYNEKLLKQDLSRIFATQAFSDIRRVLSASPEDPEKYRLTVEVDEKRTGSISLGGGIDTGTGLFGSLGYMDNNFRGLGQQLSTSFMAGSGIVLRDQDTIKRANLQFEANFVEPRLKQTLNSLEVSAFGREFASYQVPLALERRIGTEIELARPIKRVPHLAGSVSLGVENVNIQEGDRGRIETAFTERGLDIGRRAAQLSGGTFVSLGPSLIYDTRNSFINPTDGWYASTSFKESLAVGGNTGSFGKATATVRKFYPVGEKSTFTYGGKIGTQVMGDLPEFASFRLGGATTVRGFREGDVGNGRGFMLATAEFRTPIPFIDQITDINFFRDMRAAFFMDAGSVFRETLTNEIFNRPGYGISVGTGLRVNVPGLGPIRVDYGYPLTYVGAGNKKGRFTFGFGERY
ncbi:MAG: Surface antigen [uncultured bacterium]|nr:MAG: Surface antigen [uncultured bacterium]